MDMETMNTKIQCGKIVNGSPSNYVIYHKGSGEVAQTITIQKGAISKTGLNGIFVEDLLLICIDQLEHFQSGEFKCQENEDALRHLRDALASTRGRQYERIIRGVQGKYKK